MVSCIYIIIRMRLLSMKKAYTIGISLSLIAALIAGITYYFAFAQKTVLPGIVGEAESVKTTAGDSLAQPAIPDSSIAFVKAASLRVRTAPDSTGKRKDELLKGTSLSVLERLPIDSTGRWLKVAYRDSLNGWVRSEFVVFNRVELLPQSLQKLDFEPQIKVAEYPGNPRVKVKGVYITIYTAGLTKKFDRIIEMMKRNGLNAMVIDVKDDAGKALFTLQSAEKYAPEANKYRTVRDVSKLIAKCKANNIYLIARIVSFKDPIYTAANPEKTIVYKDTQKPFTNSDGLVWASAFDRNLWDYNLAVAKECATLGFNEIQFDYVRFPAYHDYDKLDLRNPGTESKADAIQNFLKKAYAELTPYKVYISADVFGLVATVEDDLQIGQYWEAVSNVTDYICPMMYPSHYANGSYRIAIPDANPYKTMYYSALDCAKRNANIKTPAIIRPWIQDFTAAWVRGHISYKEKQIRDQLRGLNENGIEEFLLWNAANRYTDLNYNQTEDSPALVETAVTETQK